MVLMERMVTLAVPDFQVTQDLQGLRAHLETLDHRYEGRAKWEGTPIEGGMPSEDI